MVAVIGIGPKIFKSNDHNFKVNVEGNKNVVINTENDSHDLVLSTVAYIKNEVQENGQPLPSNLAQILESAMQAVEQGAIDKAIPLFQAVAESVPTPAVLNNLGVAYLAAGEDEKARGVLLKAKSTDSKRPEEIAALEHNLRQIAQAALPSVEGPSQQTEWPSVIAKITRFDDAGGLVTLEVVYTIVCPGNLCGNYRS